MKKKDRLPNYLLDYYFCHLQKVQFFQIFIISQSNEIPIKSNLAENVYVQHP